MSETPPNLLFYKASGNSFVLAPSSFVIIDLCRILRRITLPLLASQLIAICILISGCCYFDLSWKHVMEACQNVLVLPGGAPEVVFDDNRDVTN